jgi:type VI secretion system protein ImpE
MWVPFTQLRAIHQEAPADLRDQVWMPATFTWANGGEGIGFIPARYPGSTGGDPLLALGRRTEWVEKDGWSLGLGQRLLATDEGDTALLDLRALILTPAEEDAAEESAHEDVAADGA